MPLLPAALKDCDFLITLEISSLEIDRGNCILARYEVLGILLRSAFSIGGKNQDFRSSAFTVGVVGMPDRVTGLGIVRGVGGRWLLSFDHFASGQIPLLSHAASATAYLKCEALAFWMTAPFALSASRYALQF
jgi:hypothetical protein